MCNVTVQQFINTANEAGLKLLSIVTNVPDMANLQEFLKTIPGLADMPVMPDLTSMYIFSDAAGAAIANVIDGCVVQQELLLGANAAGKILSLLSSI